MSMPWRRVGIVLLATPVIVGCTGILYLQYRMRNIPIPARKHLRRALLAHHYGSTDYLAGSEYEAAIRYSLNGGLLLSSPEVTGVYEHLADYYHKTGNVAARRATLAVLFGAISRPPVGKNETMSERTQRLKTAMKAAQWASEAAEEAKDTAEARSYLEWIVENSLVLDSEHSGSSAASDSTSAVISAGSLRVNPWASPRQTGMALEQLGHIYADSMLMDWAIPVYQRALEMLNQDKDLSFLERQCRSAILHNNLAECLTKFENNKEALSQALQLASISIKTLQKAGPAGVCGECDPIAHYNLGAILDKLERRRDAIDYFKLALVRSQNIGFVQGIEQANLALNKPASTVTNP
ncbi:hypothetical protein BASA83_008640 [Batrachochytrium salamandrivorans]|nr:hypothetical protein BASA62_001736 [Batrachochytrium salamandrivorans]KAH9269278.1 hypothetical protein BASA83_008640 [Batrachochytrium salamandrivorans]